MGRIADIKSIPDMLKAVSGSARKAKIILFQFIDLQQTNLWQMWNPARGFPQCAMSQTMRGFSRMRGAELSNRF
ncbi:MAG: hypothetical protein OXI87_15855 [Albidovulum sp.]|nr:hypothetical protein [Albidovulum sp.]MDE0306331.1 hypothetical protein [Albidovulum sp.]MDE0531734.1 hypothetical protein [Albidovulum sp.]